MSHKKGVCPLFVPFLSHMKSLVALGLSLVSLVFLYIIKIKSNIYIYCIYIIVALFLKKKPNRQKEGTEGTALVAQGFRHFLKMGQQMGQKLAALTRSRREVRFKKWDTKMGHNELRS